MARPSRPQTRTERSAPPLAASHLPSLVNATARTSPGMSSASVEGSSRPALQSSTRPSSVPATTLPASIGLNRAERMGTALPVFGSVARRMREGVSALTFRSQTRRSVFARGEQEPGVGREIDGRERVGVVVAPECVQERPRSRSPRRRRAALRPGRPRCPPPRNAPSGRTPRRRSGSLPSARARAGPRGGGGRSRDRPGRPARWPCRAGRGSRPPARSRRRSRSRGSSRPPARPGGPRPAPPDRASPGGDSGRCPRRPASRPGRDGEGCAGGPLPPGRSHALNPPSCSPATSDPPPARRRSR